MRPRESARTGRRDVEQRELKFNVKIRFYSNFVVDILVSKVVSDRSSRRFSCLLRALGGLRRHDVVGVFLLGRIVKQLIVTSSSTSRFLLLLLLLGEFLLREDF
jgi:hypothetical protein